MHSSTILVPGYDAPVSVDERGAVAVVALQQAVKPHNLLSCIVPAVTCQNNTRAQQISRVQNGHGALGRSAAATSSAVQAAPAAPLLAAPPFPSRSLSPLVRLPAAQPRLFAYTLAGSVILVCFTPAANAARQ